MASHRLVLPFLFKKTPFYLNKARYLEFNTKVIKQRIQKLCINVFNCYNKQKGTCEFCNQRMKIEFILKKNMLKIVKLYSIKFQLIEYLYVRCYKKSLLHRFCYNRIYQIFSKSKKTKLPFKIF